MECSLDDLEGAFTVLEKSGTRDDKRPFFLVVLGEEKKMPGRHEVVDEVLKLNVFQAVLRGVAESTRHDPVLSSVNASLLIFPKKTYYFVKFRNLRYRTRMLSRRRAYQPTISLCPLSLSVPVVRTLMTACVAEEGSDTGLLTSFSKFSVTRTIKRCRTMLQKA